MHGELPGRLSPFDIPDATGILTVVTDTVRGFLVIFLAVLGLALSLVLAAVLDIAELYVVAVAFLGIVAAAYWNSLDDVVMAGLALLMFGAIAVMLVVNG
jgi:hypothetical protein